MTTIAEAIGIIEHSMGIHQEWIAYFEGNPDERQHAVPKVEIAGDVEHHRGCIARYEKVIEVLRRFEGRE